MTDEEYVRMARQDYATKGEIEIGDAVERVSWPNGPGGDGGAWVSAQVWVADFRVREGS